MFFSTLRRSVFAPRSFPSRPLIPARQFQTSTLLQRDAESRDKINTESREYSGSGGDGAATNDTAFDPDQTRPEEERESSRREAGGEEKNDPLNVSPANPEVSKARGAQEGGAAGSKGETGSGGERARSSGKGSPVKGGAGAESG